MFVLRCCPPGPGGGACAWHSGGALQAQRHGRAGGEDGPLDGLGRTLIKHARRDAGNSTMGVPAAPGISVICPRPFRREPIQQTNGKHPGSPWKGPATGLREQNMAFSETAVERVGPTQAWSSGHRVPSKLAQLSRRAHLNAVAFSLVAKSESCRVLSLLPSLSEPRGSNAEALACGVCLCLRSADRAPKRRWLRTQGCLRSASYPGHECGRKSIAPRLRFTWACGAKWLRCLLRTCRG